jgi:predicted lipoprotein with Yx(FWY)xxD motif
MNKLYKNTSGFGAIEAFLIVIIVAIIAFVGWYVWHVNNDTNTTTPYSNNQTTTKSKDTTNKSENTGAIIETKTDATVGQYLADGNGKTLYTYGGDTAGVSNCSGACIANWPVYAAAQTTSLPANVSVITRSDGSKQYAYKNLPLYYFTADQTGQVTGDNVENFHVAKP